VCRAVLACCVDDEQREGDVDVDDNNNEYNGASNWEIKTTASRAISGPHSKCGWVGAAVTLTDGLKGTDVKCRSGKTVALLTSIDLHRHHTAHSIPAREMSHERPRDRANCSDGKDVRWSFVKCELVPGQQQLCCGWCCGDHKQCDKPDETGDHF
jgi:hypothetical protein